MKVNVDFKIQDREALKSLLLEIQSKNNEPNALEEVEPLKDLMEDTENIDPGALSPSSKHRIHEILRCLFFRSNVPRRFSG